MFTQKMSMKLTPGGRNGNDATKDVTADQIRLLSVDDDVDCGGVVIGKSEPKTGKSKIGH